MMVYCLIGFLASVALNFLFSRFWKFPFLKSRVKSDRWGEKPVPLGGGPVIFLIVSGFLLIRLFQLGFPRDIVVVLIGGAMMFALGLIDDLLDLKSEQKFIAEIVIVLMVVYLGIRATLFPHAMLNFTVTFFWILAITNAFNLLDNMDGLMGGIAAIASLFLSMNFFLEKQIFLNQIGLTLASVLVGFLIFNFRPARIYMGDSGALFTGYLLSVLAVLGSQKAGTSLFVTIVFPVVLVAVPILDTVLVSVTREMRGQSPFQGGKDHLSHRLVTLGMSDRQAVVFLYAIALALGLSTLLMRRVPLGLSFAVYFFGSVALVLFGIYIGKIKIVPFSAKPNGLAGLNLSPGPHRWLLPMCVDVLLIAAVYYFSYLIRFEGVSHPSDLNLLLRTLPLILVFKLISMSYFGVFKINTRYFSILDALKVVKGVTVGSTLTVLVLTFIYRFSGFSRALFFIDWMLSLLVLGGVKGFFRMMDELFYPLKTQKSRKVVFIGDMETYQAIHKFLQIKEEVDYSLAGHVPPEGIDRLTEGDFLLPDGTRISLVLVEEKYRERVGRKRIGQWRNEGFAVANEKEFLSRIIH